MRDPACNRGPASIGTSESDPRPVCGARRLFGARLLSEVLRYIYFCEYARKVFTESRCLFRVICDGDLYSIVIVRITERTAM